MCIKALFAAKDRQSVLGTYSIDANGDTTLTDYGLYEVKPTRPAAVRPDASRRLMPSVLSSDLRVVKSGGEGASGFCRPSP